MPSSHSLHISTHRKNSSGRPVHFARRHQRQHAHGRQSLPRSTLQLLHQAARRLLRFGTSSSKRRCLELFMVCLSDPMWPHMKDTCLASIAINYEGCLFHRARRPNSALVAWRTRIILKNCFHFHVKSMDWRQIAMLTEHLFHKVGKGAAAYVNCLGAAFEVFYFPLLFTRLRLGWCAGVALVFFRLHHPFSLVSSNVSGLSVDARALLLEAAPSPCAAAWSIPCGPFDLLDLLYQGCSSFVASRTHLPSRSRLLSRPRGPHLWKTPSPLSSRLDVRPCPSGPRSLIWLTGDRPPCGCPRLETSACDLERKTSPRGLGLKRRLGFLSVVLLQDDFP